MYRQFRSKVTVVQEGVEPLPFCEFCVMHIPAGRLIRHRRTVHWDKNTQMRSRRKDVAIASRCLEAMFGLTGEEDLQCIKGVEVFKCLRQLLYQLDENWPAVLCNIRKAWQVWERLGKLLPR